MVGLRENQWLTKEEEGGGSKRPKQDEKKGTIKERGKGEEIIKS